MKSLVVLLALVIASVVPSGAFAAGGPRVVLGVEASGSQRYLQITDRGGPVYPSADVTCDGNRRTLMLTRSSQVADKIVATYVVSPKISDAMIKSAECRVLLPGRDIGISRQQIRAAWSSTPRAQKR
jgi:hypothetical protein